MGYRCPADGDGSQCPGTKFKEVTDSNMPTDCRDYQEIKVQEQVSTLKMGTIPRALTGWSARMIFFKKRKTRQEEGEGGERREIQP